VRATKILVILSIIFLACTPCFGHGNGLADTYVHVGKGCTTAYYIDDDCDGYGIGEQYVRGPDADETDVGINTTASILTRYSTNPDPIGTFIKVRMQALTGKPNGGILKFAVIDYVNGNDTTGARSTSLTTAITTPYKTWGNRSPNGTVPGNGPGDCYVIRGGTSTNNFVFAYNAHKSGTAANPIYIIPYPGEKVNYTKPVALLATHRSYAYRTMYLYFDGMGGGFVANAMSSGGTAQK